MLKIVTGFDFSQFSAVAIYNIMADAQIAEEDELSNSSETSIESSCHENVLPKNPAKKYHKVKSVTELFKQ